MSSAPNGANLGTFLSQVEKDKESVYKMAVEWWIRGTFSQWKGWTLFQQLKLAHCGQPPCMYYPPIHPNSE